MKKSNLFLTLVMSVLMLFTSCDLLSSSNDSILSSSEVSSSEVSSSEMISSESSNSEHSEDIDLCNHTYTNDCDSTCNICSASRTVNHKYVYTEQKATDFHYGINYYSCDICGEYKSVSFEEPISDVIERPDISIKEYAYLASKKARQQAKEIFEVVENKGEKDLYMMPYTEISRFKEIKDFTLELTKECKTDYEKIETIFIWITTNIKYDENAQTYPIYNTFIEKKGVCFGFTSLMHDMLSAVDIMSSYTSGYVQREGINFNDIYNYNRLKDYCHAWLLIYCNNEVIFADPTWGVYNLTDEQIKKTHVTIDTDEINVIPDEVDCRLFVNAIYKLGDCIVNLVNGEIWDFGGLSISRNLVKTTEFIFHTSNDGYVYNGYTHEKTAYTNGLIYYDNFDDSLNTYYACSNGHCYSYRDVVAYVKLMEKEYSKEIDLQFEEEFFITDNDFVFKNYGDDVVLYSYFGYEEKITIPSEVNGKKVKEIAPRAFEENNIIKEVVVEEGIEKIGDSAFANTHGLEKISLPNSLRIIETAFIYSELKELVIPEGVEEFAGVVGCHYLEKITLPNVPYLEDNEIISFCENLKEINVYESNPYCKTINGVLFSKDGKTIYQYPASMENETYEIPVGVEIIGKNSFNSTQNLKEVIVPNSVKKIEERAFYVSSIERINIPDGITKIEQETFYGSSIKEISLPESINEISGSAFSDCNSLESVYIPKNVDYVFFGWCSSLKNIEINLENPYLKSVDDVIYSKDGKILYFYPIGKQENEYTVLEGVETICNSAFAFNSDLKVINLPNSLKKIEVGGFSRFEGEYLVIPESVETLEMEAISQCYNVSLYYNWNKNEVPSGVYIHNNVLNYYNGEWEYVNGVPTPVTK